MIFHFLFQNNFIPMEGIQTPISHDPATIGNARLFAKTGLWTQEQKNKYLLFLLHHQPSMQDGQGNSKVEKGMYQAMSRWVGSRKANQCRQYHKKMEQYYQSISMIINQLSQSLQKPDIVKQEQISNQPQPMPKMNQEEIMKEEEMPQLKISACEEEKNVIISEKIGQVTQNKLIIVEERRKRKPSITICDQESKEEKKEEEELPRTDHTIRDQPSSSQPIRRTTLSISFEDNPEADYPQFSSTPSLHLPPVTTTNTLEPDEQQWLTCHTLYLTWLHKWQSLTTRPPPI